MKSNRLAVFALATIALLWASPAYGQSDRGNLTGTITDPSGAVVSGVRVTVTSLDTGEVREATTSGEGNYTVPQLPANTYRVSVEADGFKTATIEDVKIAVQVTRTADFQLEVGGAGETVTVIADAPVIQTDSPVRQTNVTERQVRELPLVVSSEVGGRTPLAFIFLDSNVTGQGGGGTNASSFRVSGGQALGTEILIDGAATRRSQNGTFFSEVSPSPNAFQEFTISTSGFSAEFGNTSGGIVNFTIKSGGNQFHGEAYELHRNTALNANSFLNNAAGRPRNIDLQHDFGFNVGGPIYLPRFGEGGPTYISGKNRSFFFFNYEGYRFNQSETIDVSVPTLRMRQGDFGELLTDPVVLQQFGSGGVTIFDPRSGGPGRRTQFANNIIPNSAFDPAGFNILQFFPLPTRPGVFRNYTASSSNPTTMNNYVFKLDNALTNSQRLAVSYSFRKLDRLAGGFPRFPEPFVAFGRFDQVTTSHFARLTYDYSITPTLLNHFNAGFTRYNSVNANTTRGFDTFSLGIPRTSVLGGSFPSIDFPYGGGTESDPNPNRNTLRAYQGIGSSFFNDLPFADNTTQLSDSVTYIRGRHTMKFGADLRFQQFNAAQLLGPGGWFNFRHNQTANGNNPNNPDDFSDTQGWPVASLLTGATEFAFNSNKTLDPGYRYFLPAVFFQDDIKVTQSLTLNLGVRYEIPGPRTESKGRLRGFDPDVMNPTVGRRGALVAANGLGGLQAENPGIAPRDYSAFAPRVGFAYSLNNRTVVRGGYGIFYNPILYGVGGANIITEGTEGYNSFPVYPNTGANANTFLSNFPVRPSVDPTNQFIANFRPERDGSTAESGDVTFFDKDFKSGRTQQYTLDVQRELPYNFAVSLGYIGNRGTRLRSQFNRLNAIPLEALRLGGPLLRKPLSQVTDTDRAYAQRVGITLPANPAAVYTTAGTDAMGNAIRIPFGGNVAQSLRPFPQYRTVNSALEHEGQSFYNAFQAKVDRRFAQGIQFGASYTFSKLITDASEDLFGGSALNGVLQNPNDRRSLRAVSPSDIPHVLVLNYVLELPFGKGRRFLNSGGIVDKLIGGFQISGIQRYETGRPLVIVSSRNNGFLGSDIFGVGGNLRPNLTGQPILTGNQESGSQFRAVNPAAFSQPLDFGAAPTFADPTPTDPNRRTQFPIGSPEYTTFYADPTRFFGTAPPTLDDFRVSPFYSENISLLKKTGITETVTMELRGEFFNVFNRTRFGGPASNFGDVDPASGNPGNFGNVSIDAGYAPRIVQVGIRLIF